MNKLLYFFYGLLILTFLCFADVSLAQIKIDDVSRLNETVVSAIRQPLSEKDIQDAVSDALASGKRVSIAGRRHSQGGHIMVDDAIVLDMLRFNKIKGLNADKTILTVQSGATWADVQNYLNAYNLAVKVQQSSNIFTIGGSLSANIHGRDPRYGAIIETVRSFRLVKADGEVIQVSRDQNSEYFPLVIGGYGLFGIITEVDLEVNVNSVLQKDVLSMGCGDYVAHLREHILDDEKVELHYARPDITRANFMKDCTVVSYSEIGGDIKSFKPLQTENLVSISQWFMNLSRRGDFGKKIRWFIQNSFVDVPGETDILSRNNAMRPPVEFLDYWSEADTDVLQEYFVPLDHARDFMRALKDTVQEHDINVLSITLRFMAADKESFLPYSKEDTLAFVLYVNHGRDKEEIQKARIWTRELIGHALEYSGSYYLTYSNYATPSQIQEAYPNIDTFFRLKRRYDPSELFINKFYEHYGAISW